MRFDTRLAVVALIVLMMPTFALGEYFPSMRDLIRANDAVLFVEVGSDQDKPGDEAYDLKTVAIVKTHPSLMDAKTLPKAFKSKFKAAPLPKKVIAFGAQEKGTWHWGFIIATDDMASYLKGLAPLKDEQEILRHCFRFFASTDKDVAYDALDEWVAAKPQPVAEAAKALAADHVRLVVQNTKAIFPSRCFASYLLVSCGAKKDAELVRPLLDVKAGKDGHWLEYALRGFVLLDADSGWKHLQTRMAKSDEKGFETRYAYLRTVRFLYEDRPGVVPKRDIERLLAAMLEHSDIADFVIGYLAHWKCWDYTEQILALPQRKTHDIRIIKRSVLRYAMFCPSKECQRYVEEERRRDPDFVRDVEEILKFEMQSAGASNAAK